MRRTLTLVLLVRNVTMRRELQSTGRGDRKDGTSHLFQQDHVLWYTLFQSAHQASLPYPLLQLLLSHLVALPLGSAVPGPPPEELRNTWQSLEAVAQLPRNQLTVIRDAWVTSRLEVPMVGVSMVQHVVTLHR